jgi:hypothetical protein
VEPEPQTLRRIPVDSNIPLVGLVGHPGTGKDEIARVLVQRDGWIRMAFADEMKAALVHLEPRLLGVRHLDALKRDGNYWRKRMQLFGDYVRTIDSDYWIRQAAEIEERLLGSYSVFPPAGIIYTDIRYFNEYRSLLARGAKVIGIHRKLCGPINKHVTEENTRLLLDQVEDHVYNDGSPEEAADAILGIVHL